MGSGAGSSPKRGAVESYFAVKDNFVGSVVRSSGAIDVDGGTFKKKL